MASYDDVMSLCLRRGFLYPTAEIYGGLAGLYDYGSAGARLKRNWEDLWLRTFLGLHDSAYLIDSSTLLPEKPLKASGHVDLFTDWLVECRQCHTPYKADQLAEAVGKSIEGFDAAQVDAFLQAGEVRCPKCGGKAYANAQPFHTMFPVAVGPKGEERAYLRPETAQGTYLAFKREFEVLRRRLPLALAAIGRAYRNEISPRQGPYRMREFLQAELQVFFDPAAFDAQVPFDDVASERIRVAFADEKKEGKASDVTAAHLVERGLPRFYVYHMAAVQRFYTEDLGLPPEVLRFAELSEAERAFYNRIHFDVELKLESLGGFREVAGVHYRTDHDLGGHQRLSGESLEVAMGNRKVVPHVLELSFGVDRNLWALLDLRLEKGERTVLRFPSPLAPVAVGVFPLLRKDGLPERAEAIYRRLRTSVPAFYDDGGSIGRRYARMDELGTPFCVTVDHPSLTADDVTLRDRDSTRQRRVPAADLDRVLADLLHRRVVFGALPYPEVAVKDAASS